MANEIDFKAAFERDFIPNYTRSSVPASEHRVAQALEYTAHHMGRISRNLEKLIELMEKKGT